MERHGVAVVGGGLAGLACALELAEGGADVVLLEARDVVGGRTSSWRQDGMPVESGLHRYLGYFSELTRLLQRVGVNVDNAVCWEDEIEIRSPDAAARGVFGLSPRRPLRTLAGALGNNALLGPLDKASLGPFLAAGVRDYLVRPDHLDTWSVADYAIRYGVRRRAIDHLLVPLTAGTFFLPPERFSAYYFFGLVTPGLPRLHHMRLGAFNGGMTEVMAGPVADAVERAGGQVRTRAPVEQLLVDDGRVAGVRTAAGDVAADQVVLATSLTPAQALLRPAFGEHPWFQPLLELPSTPSVTLQVELDAASMDVDRTVFAPGTVLACFAEQRRTTFPHLPGRVSIILSPPERFLDMAPEEVLEVACADADRIGLPLRDHVTDHRVVVLAHDFPALEPGHMAKRPPQVTPVDGLTLAGDYTRQRFVATMEGAVHAGRIAASAVRMAAAPRPVRRLLPSGVRACDG